MTMVPGLCFSGKLTTSRGIREIWAIEKNELLFARRALASICWRDILLVCCGMQPDTASPRTAAETIDPKKRRRMAIPVLESIDVLRSAPAPSDRGHKPSRRATNFRHFRAAAAAFLDMCCFRAAQRAKCRRARFGRL